MVAKPTSTDRSWPTITPLASLTGGSGSVAWTATPVNRSSTACRATGNPEASRNAMVATAGVMPSAGRVVGSMDSVDWEGSVTRDTKFTTAVWLSAIPWASAVSVTSPNSVEAMVAVTVPLASVIPTGIGAAPAGAPLINTPPEGAACSSTLTLGSGVPVVVRTATVTNALSTPSAMSAAGSTEMVD